MAVIQKIGGKKGRIIVRNLSYKATEDDIIQYFKPFGDIKDHNVLKFNDGRLKGVAFIEYNNLLSAMKAIEERNMKNFMGRPIAVDMAVSKQWYSTNKNPSDNSKETIKVESNIEDTNLDHKDFIPPDKIKKEEDVDKKSIETGQVKIEELEVKEEVESNIDDEDDCDDGDDEDSENDNDDDDEDEDDGMDVDEEEDDDDDDGEDDDDDEDEDDDDCNMKSKKKKLKRDEDFKHASVSKDVVERRTIFIRNISFQSNEDEIREILSRFGNLKYVIFCKDSTTGKFRGTAFAQFVESSSCEKCLEAFEDPVYKDTFIVGGRTLFLIPAVGRDEISKKKELKASEKEKTDKRNLYLAREGVVRAGTKPSIGVSKSDLNLRVNREMIKRKMLANFNIFVSPTRLFICNLPLELTDRELKEIFTKHSPKESVIKECRIMKNLFNFDANGKPISKGHGFVAFTEHAHALEALRRVNNNPDIFRKDKRPVVEFSLENSAALKAKEARLNKSKQNNSFKRKKTQGANNVQLSMTNENEFMGSKYEPGRKGFKAFHSHIGPKIRHRDTKSKGSKKITRNQVNNKMRNSQMSQRWKEKVQKSNSKSSSKKGNKSKKSSTSKNKKSESKSKNKKKKFIQ
ncbi:UNVERIFIED_CONTAM: hypothetical protein RMT77_010255 [Armadillidium vulgare]